MNALRDAVLKGEMDPEAKLEIKLDHEMKEGQRVVISNEGFSTAFLNSDSSDQEKVGSYVNYAASMLGQLLPGFANVLLVVRDPISWLRSIHAQSIREGGFLSTEEFVQKQFFFIYHSLDLRSIYESYEQNFANTRVLNFELLKENEAAFWQRIEDWFGVPAPQGAVERRNESLESLDTLLLARLNRIGGNLLGALRDSVSYSHWEEKQKLIEAYGGSGSWVHRRFVEFASDEEKRATAELVGLGGGDDAFFEFSLPAELKAKIEQDFVGFLEERGFVEESVLGKYRNSLKRLG